MTEREKERMLRIKGKMYDDLRRDWLNCCEEIGYLKKSLEVARQKLSRYEQEHKKSDTPPEIKIIKGIDFYAN